MIDPDEENIHNTFAPNITNEYFSINDIIDCLRHGFMRMSKLPSEIAIQVHEQLNIIKSKRDIYIGMMPRSKHSYYLNNWVLKK